MKKRIAKPGIPCYNAQCVRPKRVTPVLGCRQAVRHQTLTLTFVGSNPAIPAKYDPLAQSVEQLPFKQWVRGSNPRRVTKEAHTHPGMCFFAVGGSNHSLEQSCGLFLTGGWTPVTPYAVPCTVAPNPRRVTNALSFWLQLPKRSAIIFSKRM